LIAWHTVIFTELVQIQNCTPSKISCHNLLGHRRNIASSSLKTLGMVF